MGLGCSEFKKSLEAKEIEVNHLVEEQSALLVKLKSFWQPILNSSSAKIFHEKNPKSVNQEGSMAEKEKTPKSLKEKRVCSAKTVETQTDDYIAGENAASPKDSGCEQGDLPQNEEIFPKIKERGFPCSRLSTPGRKNRQTSKPGKKNDDDLIASFLTKLQKAYVKSREVSSDPFASAQPVDTLLPKFSPTTPQNEGMEPMEARHTPRSSVGSKESFEINDAISDNLAQYVICVPRREPRNTSGNTFFLKTRRKKKAVASNHFLKVRLQNLEDLSEALLSKGHYHL